MTGISAYNYVMLGRLTQKSKYIFLYIPTYIHKYVSEHMTAYKAFTPSKLQRFTKRKISMHINCGKFLCACGTKCSYCSKTEIKNVISDQRQAVIILRVYVYVRVCVCTYVCMLCYKPEGCFQSL